MHQLSGTFGDWICLLMISKDEGWIMRCGVGESSLMSDMANPTASESLSPVSLMSASNHLRLII